MDIAAANLSSTQNSMFAEDEGNDEDVWGMPKYQQNYSLENLTDEQYLARVCIMKIHLAKLDLKSAIFRGKYG